MLQIRYALTLAAGCLFAASAAAHGQSPVSIEIVGPDGQIFREFPLNTSDGTARSYLQAAKGARYQVRVHNAGGERLGLVIAVDGRNIINGEKSELARNEPMYVLAGWETESYAGWRASLDAINEFYFTDWQDSYAEAFGDRSARGVIAIAVYREVPPPPVYQAPVEEQSSRNRDAAPPVPAARGAAKDESARRRDQSPGTGYGDRRIDRAVPVEFVAQADADSRHFIKYEWPETLCRKRVMECGESNRFWDEGALGFAPAPPRH